jgi:hypothetical protein
MVKKPTHFKNPLVRLHRGLHVSARALEFVLKDVRTHGVPKAVSRKGQQRARRAAVQTESLYGQLLQLLRLTVDSQPWETVLIQPMPLLEATIRECAPFRALMRQKLRLHPCSVDRPWNIVIYFDGVTPTDPCSTKVDRHKIECFYWTFMEFADLIFEDIIWFIAACAPTVEVARLETGMSQTVKHIMRKCFFDTAGHNFATGGMHVDMSEPGEAPDMVRLFARHQYTIADFAALKEVVTSMGQRGLKPCPKCSNIVKDDCADGASLLPLSSLEPHRWRIHTDQTLRDTQAYLAAQKLVLGPTAFQDLETRMGFHFNENSILHGDADFGAISTMVFDWPHTYFSGGLFTKELIAFMDLAREITPRGQKAVLRFQDLHEYMTTWTFPKRWASCKMLFAKGTIAGTMSEQLSAAPILREYFEHVVLAELAVRRLHAAARCVVAACIAVEMLHCGTRQRVSRAELVRVVDDHNAQHQRCHGVKYWTLKNHLAMHIARQSLPELNTFVTERRHKEPKRFARQALKLTGSGYNQYLMEELLCQHLSCWAEWPGRSPGLRGSSPLSRRREGDIKDLKPEWRHLSQSDFKRSCTYLAESGETFHAGDCVLLGGSHDGSCGLVQDHVEVLGDVWTCLQIWPLIASEGGRCTKHRIDETPRFLSSKDLKTAVCFRASGPNAVVRIPMCCNM